MFKIKDLTSLFDEQVRQLLEESYYLSQEKNKELSDNVFERFLFLKKLDPSINIVPYPNSKKKNSYFSGTENVIYLNDLMIDTFFHELTHLLSYHYSKFKIPYEYHSIREGFFLKPYNHDLIISFIELCNKEVKKCESKFLTLFDKVTDQQIVQYNTIIAIEDIIDAMYNGTANSYGLEFSGNEKCLPVKTYIIAGHGCEYYSKNNVQFEEILANYQEIKLTDPENELFIMLKDILGEEFITFLDDRCSIICGKIPKIINDDGDVGIRNEINYIIDYDKKFEELEGLSNKSK